MYEILQIIYIYYIWMVFVTFRGFLLLLLPWALVNFCLWYRRMCRCVCTSVAGSNHRLMEELADPSRVSVCSNDSITDSISITHRNSLSGHITGLSSHIPCSLSKDTLRHNLWLTYPLCAQAHTLSWVQKTLHLIYFKLSIYVSRSIQLLNVSDHLLGQNTAMM